MSTEPVFVPMTKMQEALWRTVINEFNKAGRDPRLLIGFKWDYVEEPFIRVILYRENTEQLPEEARGQAFVWIGEVMERANRINPVILEVLDYVPK